MKSQYDAIILVDAGIGNAIQTLPALEYARSIDIKAGVYLANINRSFQTYLKECYGEGIILNIEEVKCHHLVHTFTYQKAEIPQHQSYYYINPDYHSSKLASETEQILELVKSLFPGGVQKDYLTSLVEADTSEKLESIEIQGKYILYPGGSAINSARRWPHYMELIRSLGEDRTILIGGKDDINFTMSYIYPKWLTKILPQAILNRKPFWNFSKKVGLLNEYAHYPKLETYKNAYIEHFSWKELVYLFRRAKGFVGNDGGLLHLAAACGLKGVTLFGPTSEKKNKPFFSGINILTNELGCRPCQFGVGRVQMTTGFINCPFQMKCMQGISVDSVISQLENG